MRFDSDDNVSAILRRIEVRALGLRDTPPPGAFATVADTAARIDLPMERLLYRPPERPAPARPLSLDKTVLIRRVEHALRSSPQVSLQSLCHAHPLAFGLAELIAYLQLESDTFRCVIDDSVIDAVAWRLPGEHPAPAARRARMPRALFVRIGS